jgi:adenylosuccinate synthase
MAQKTTGKNIAVAAGIAGLAAAAIAGGYFFYGKDGAKHRKTIKAWSIKAKGEVLEKLEKAKELSEEAFHQAVDAAAVKYSKTKNVAPEEIADFAKNLKKHWKDIKREINPTPKKKAAAKK